VKEFGQLSNLNSTFTCRYRFCCHISRSASLPFNMAFTADLAVAKRSHTLGWALRAVRPLKYKYVYRRVFVVANARSDSPSDGFGVPDPLVQLGDILQGQLKASEGLSPQTISDLISDNARRLARGFEPIPSNYPQGSLPLLLLSIDHHQHNSDKFVAYTTSRHLFMRCK
jgi:hypothetical protein